MLRTGRDLGEAPAAPPAATAEALADLALAGITTLRGRSDVLLATLAARLRRAQWLRMTGAVVAALANAGLLASLSRLFGISAPGVDAALALLGLLAATLTIVADRAAGGGGTPVAGLFATAATLGARVLGAEQRTRRTLRRSPDAEAIELILDELDEIARVQHELEATTRVA
ncbi:hypothetical protein [Paracraurococcus ruber]|nr:hypothetical protein [Paracraurococcus ruber]TDG13281.1 hypothetical protein E2C05_30140 [Paracraurococcus ruber]